MLESDVNRHFEHHYEYFERFIREVLHTRGLKYDPSTSYYNDVFDTIFRRVFKCECLCQYDPARGGFRTWLRRVTRNAVYDWIKSAHPTLPVTRGTQAHLAWHAESGAVSLDQAEPHERDSLLAEAVAAADAPEEHEGGEGGAETRADRALAALGEEYRAVVELCGLAARPVSAPSVAFIARAGARSLAETEAELETLRGQLLARAEGENRAASGGGKDCLEDTMVLSWEQEKVCEWEIRRLELALRGAGCPETEIECGLEEAGTLTLGQLREARRDMRGLGIQQRLMLDLQFYELRRRKWRKRREELKILYLSPLPQPSYRQIATLLGRSESSLAGLLDRAKRSLKKIISDLGEGSGDKTRNP